MTFDIYELLDKGFLVFFAVVVLYAIFKTGKLFTTYIPTLLESGKEFVKVWHDFVDAVENNSEAVVKNTEITDANYKHSETVLKELKLVSDKFESHDYNALEVKKSVEELIDLVKNADDKKEVLNLLRKIINKLEEEN